jgi:ABC-type antimicrobial peptide transport system permease subunit
VVGNAKQRTLGEGDVPTVYVPLGQNLGKIMSLTGIALVARASSPATMLEAVRREIHAVDPNLAVFNALTMKDQVEKAMLLPRLIATLFTIFGLSGLALAVVGLYGVMSFSVGRRTREIGIRMALGAERGNILAMVTRQGLALTGVGLVIGVVLALAASRFAESLLYGVSPRDLATFVSVPLILGAAGLAASVIPARRAAKLDPMAALRYE